MAEINYEEAKKVFQTLVDMLDHIGWHYEKIEEKLMIKSSVKGEDLPIDFIVVVKPKQQIVQLLSSMPFEMPEDKRVDGAIAVCVANYGLCDGSFDYDIADGQIIFRLTSSYRESILSEELFRYMVMVSAGTIDDYNDKFFMIAKGMMSIQQFMESEKAE